MREIDVRYAAAGAEVVAVRGGDLGAALDLHISAEPDLARAGGQAQRCRLDEGGSTSRSASCRRCTASPVRRGHLLGRGLLIALGLGAALSWSVIRPVWEWTWRSRASPTATASRSRSGPRRVRRLTTNLNWTGSSSRLYRDSDLSRTWKTVEEQLGRLRRAEELRRTSAPQSRRRRPQRRRTRLAHLTRRNLSILVAKIRGQLDVRGHGAERSSTRSTALRGDQWRRRVPPRRTLDNYIGDGVLAFFGDYPFEDHAQLAVMTALEMSALQLRGDGRRSGTAASTSGSRDHRLRHRRQHQLGDPHRVRSSATT
jgi:hypothetical protein